MEVNKSYDEQSIDVSLYEIYSKQIAIKERELYDTLKELEYQLKNDTNCIVYVANLFNECLEISKEREKFKRERDRVEKEFK